MIAEELSEWGLTVYGMDLRGHGFSDGTRGDHPSRDRLVKDLSETISLVRAGSNSLIVLGHSLGVWAAFVAENNSSKDIDGLILLRDAPKTGVHPKPKTNVVLKTSMGVTLLRGTTLIDYCRGGMIGPDDPLFNFKYSARFYTVLLGRGALAVSRMVSSGYIDSPDLRFAAGKLKVPFSWAPETKTNCLGLFR